jgi:hypothetical protein
MIRGRHFPEMPCILCSNPLELLTDCLRMKAVNLVHRECWVNGSRVGARCTTHALTGRSLPPFCELGPQLPLLPSVSNRFRAEKRSPMAVAAGDPSLDPLIYIQPRQLRALLACRSCPGRSLLHPSKKYLVRRSAPRFPSPSWSTRSCRSGRRAGSRRL